MAINQGLRMQMPEIFATMVVFILAYATMLVASHKSKHTNEKTKPINGISGSVLTPSILISWYKQPLPPQPHIKFYLYAKNCLDKIDDKKCVEQIVNGTLYKTKVNVKCGCKIKTTGRMCMMAVAGTTDHMDKYKADADSIYKMANKILDKSDKLSKCPAT